MPQLNAADNPALAEQVIQKVMTPVEEPVAEEVVELDHPEDHVFTLPGGYMYLDGSVQYEAEVRELTGRDEEALSKVKAPEKLLQDILSRGLIRVGQAKPDESVLDSLLSGDRDYILLNIFTATFGRTITVRPYCTSCQEIYEEEIDLMDKVPVRRLESPADRRLRLKISKGEVVVDLPNGTVQKKMIAAVEKSVAELSSVLLENTVAEINGMPIMSAAQVLDLPIRDRRLISEKIIENNPGPQMQEVKVTCNCGTELEVPLSLAALFQFS